MSLKPGEWAIGWECCRICGKVDNPHESGGACHRCMARNRYRARREAVRPYRAKERPAAMWSRKFDCCQICKQTDRPHVYRGICTRCIGKWPPRKAKYDAWKKSRKNSPQKEGKPKSVKEKNLPMQKCCVLVPPSFVRMMVGEI